MEDADISKLTNRVLSGLTYDAAGNVTQDTKFRQLKFRSDANGRQRQSANLDDSNAVTAIYDGAGQRVATKLNGTLSISVYDAFGKLVAEYGTAAAGAGGTQYVFQDQQGTPRVVTNGSGSVLTRHDYQPFGEELAGSVGLRTTTQGYSGGDGVKQKYAGMEADDSGLSHTLWRQYDTKSGRWTAPDPYSGSMTIAAPQSFNRYSYVNNDPVNKVDPLGLRLIDIGVVQTDDPAEADRLEHQILSDLQTSVNDDYRKRHEPRTTLHESLHCGGLGQTGQQDNKKKIDPPTEDEVEVTNNKPEGGEGYHLFAEGYGPLAFNSEPIIDEEGKYVTEGGVTYDQAYGYGILV